MGWRSYLGASKREDRCEYQRMMVLAEAAGAKPLARRLDRHASARPADMHDPNSAAASGQA